MKILQLARSRVLLWAWKPGDDRPFEVSKVVERPLQGRCPSAPRCPDEEGGGAPPGWIDPYEPPLGACPYAFERRGECVDHRNQLALEAALFRPQEAALTRRLLEALGYDVSDEAIDPVASEGERILHAHGYISAGHEIRVLQGPLGEIVMVRDLEEPQGKARRRRRRRARPIGGGS